MYLKDQELSLHFQKGKVNKYRSYRPKSAIDELRYPQNVLHKHDILIITCKE